MNESTVSSAFQKKLRESIPGVEVIKHADRSMIGCPDATITGNKRTLWVEYKFIHGKTKGVTSAFNRNGVWKPADVAAASPTQFGIMQRLATAGHAFYMLWVVDYKAVLQRVGHICIWHPITGKVIIANGNDGLVTFVGELLTTESHPFLYYQR
jgi:hypothetical protein